MVSSIQALMGVNYVDYLNEAHRILKLGGMLKIAEVNLAYLR